MVYYNTKCCQAGKAGSMLNMTEQLHRLRLHNSLLLSEDSDAARTCISGSAKIRQFLSACAIIFYGDCCYPILSRSFLAVFPPGHAGDKPGPAINSCLALASLWHWQCWGSRCHVLWVKFRFPTTSLFLTEDDPHPHKAIIKKSLQPHSVFELRAKLAEQKHGQEARPQW